MPVEAMPGCRGFSTIKTLFWLAVIAVAAWATIITVGAYYTEWKIQGVFDSVAHDMADKSVSEIRARLLKIYDIQGINPDDLPQEFFDNLEISRLQRGIRISSTYHVTLWLLGAPQDESDEGGAIAKQLARLRQAASLELDFNPVAETH